jgi:hypothetical protein
LRDGFVLRIPVERLNIRDDARQSSGGFSTEFPWACGPTDDDENERCGRDKL